MKQKKNKKMTSELAIKNELKNKIILITGGAGSIGSALTAELLNYPVRSIRVFDNDEHSLFQLKQSLTNIHKILLFFQKYIVVFYHGNNFLECQSQKI